MSTKSDREILEKLEGQIDGIDKMLRGDGFEPGALSRLSQVEASIKSIQWWSKWLFTATFSALLGLGVKLLVS